MVGFRFDTAPEELKNFLTDLVADLRKELGDDLVAVLLHGSLAMGSFYPPKSDIDLLIVSKFLDAEKRRKIFSVFQKHQKLRPYAGSIEASVITDADAKNPRHPLPFLVHFSESFDRAPEFDDAVLSKDPDLAAHLTVAKQRGISLYGPKPSEVIGEVRWEDYLASVESDIDWILEGENILTSPFYGVLNLCRWMMIQGSKEHIVPSKEEAALWALANMPVRGTALIQEAFDAYRADTPVKDEHERRLAGKDWDRRPLLNFRDELRHLLGKGS